MTLKVATDANNVYFYAETAEPLTTHTDANWMLLFVDADQDSATGWNGYDCRVNTNVVSDRRTSVQHFGGDGAWHKAAIADFRYEGNQMEIKVPRSILGLTKGSVAFDFHWADNIQNLDNVIEFALHGDSAPNRRFNYRFQRQ